MEFALQPIRCHVVFSWTVLNAATFLEEVVLDGFVQAGVTFVNRARTRSTWFLTVLADLLDWGLSFIVTSSLARVVHVEHEACLTLCAVVYIAAAFGARAITSVALLKIRIVDLSFRLAFLCAFETHCVKAHVLWA